MKIFSFKLSANNVVYYKKWKSKVDIGFINIQPCFVKNKIESRLITGLYSFTNSVRIKSENLK